MHHCPWYGYNHSVMENHPVSSSIDELSVKEFQEALLFSNNICVAMV